jgi:hypothetical protein
MVRQLPTFHAGKPHSTICVHYSRKYMTQKSALSLKALHSTHAHVIADGISNSLSQAVLALACHITLFPLQPSCYEHNYIS